MEIFKKYLPLILVIVLSFFTIKSLFNFDFFPIHDDTQIARVFEMGKSLKDGVFPVRWVADLGYGYGYPIFNFYAPFAYYIGGFFNILGFNALIATKLMMLVGIILSGIFMYLLASQFWGKFGGIISAMLFMYAPYHAVDIYVRGDVAEFYAYAFIPLVFYGLWKVYEDKKCKHVVIGVLGYALIIVSHNLTALMISPFILLFGLLLSAISYKKNHNFNIGRKIFYVFFIGILLSAFYSFPALLEMKYTNILSQIGGGADFRDHFVCPIQLWSSPWGFGGSTKGCIDGLSFMLGKIHIMFAILAVVITLFFIKRVVKNNKQQLLIIIFSFVGFIVSILLTLEISKQIWESIYFMAFFQYPWRFLLLASFFSSLLGGSTIWFMQNLLKIKLKYMILISSLFIFIILFFNIKFFVPQELISKKVNDYINKVAISWLASKTSDEYMPKKFDKPKSFRTIVNSKFMIENMKGIFSDEISKTQKLSIKINAFKNTKININLAYFPAWKIFVDEKEASYTVEKNGLSIYLNKGKHFIEADFIQTLIEKISNLLSFTSVIILIIGIIYSRKKINKYEDS